MYNIYHVLFIVCIQYTVKTVLRGHLWNKDKWPCKIGDLLKEVHVKFSMTGQEKGDLLIQVTTLAGLTVLDLDHYFSLSSVS
jgi:hypothetical protein